MTAQHRRWTAAALAGVFSAGLLTFRRRLD